MHDTTTQSLTAEGLTPAILLTAAEHKQLGLQLAELRRVRDRDLPELLRGARSLVKNDAEEERLQIRDDFMVVGTRIGQLEEILHEARVVNDSATPDDVVALGRTVTVRYTSTGRNATYRLSGMGGTDSKTVSARSPLGRALLGRQVGDHVVALLPHGRTAALEIVSVRASDVNGGWL